MPRAPGIYPGDPRDKLDKARTAAGDDAVAKPRPTAPTPDTCTNHRTEGRR